MWFKGENMTVKIDDIINSKNWGLLLIIIPVSSILIVQWLSVGPVKALITPELFIFDTISHVLK